MSGRGRTYRKRTRIKGVSASAMIRALRDPLIRRGRGKGAPRLNVVISTDERQRQFVEWTCPIDGTRNRHRWFGRDYHICNTCEQPTMIPGVRVEPTVRL